MVKIPAGRAASPTPIGVAAVFIAAMIVVRLTHASDLAGEVHPTPDLADVLVATGDARIEYSRQLGVLQRRRERTQLARDGCSSLSGPRSSHNEQACPIAGRSYAAPARGSTGSSADARAEEGRDRRACR